MEFTGERVIPGEVDPDLWQEHVSRYLLARNWVRGARVLDAGCGAGYGSALLAETAAQVTGLDLSPDALEYARRHYQAPRLVFQQGDCARLPFADGEFDWVVAFEVIEHLPDAETFLREVRRVLRPHGRLAVSTPNRRFYTEERDYHNPFHVREFDAAEFEAELKRHFPCCQILEQNHVPAIVIERRAAGNGSPLGAARLPRDARDDAAAEPHFFLAVCSGEPLPETDGLVLLAEGGNVLRQREQHIHKLEADLKGFQERTNLDLAQRLEWVRSLEAQLDEGRKAVAALRASVQDLETTVLKTQGELDARSKWAEELTRQVEEKDARILERQRAVDALEEELRQRGEWAMSLARDLEAVQQRLQEEQAKLRDTEGLLEQRTEAALRLDAELARRTAWVQQLSREANDLRTDLEVLLDSWWHRTGRLLRLSPRERRSPPALRPAPKPGDDA
jgi:SAM-dependent methyltransferase